jgi:hypothetical protein
MQCFRFLVGSGVFAAMLLACTAQAAIIYVDATSGLTGNTVTGATVNGPVGVGLPWSPVGGDAIDGQWRARTGFGIQPTETAPPSGIALATLNGTVFENGGNSGGDNAPRLRTTVSGLTPGIYNVYAYFWIDQNGSPWRIRAGLSDSADPLPLYVGSNVGTTLGSVSGTAPGGGNLPILIATDNATGGTTTTPPGRRVLQVLLGQLAGVSNLNVFIEDAPPTNGNERTWYDGIGYERVIPEPSSLLLLMLGCLAAAATRRR